MTALQLMFQKAKEAKMKSQAKSQLIAQQNHLSDRQLSRKAVMEKLNNEIKLYEDEVMNSLEVAADGKFDAIKYWNESSSKYPTLAPVALDLVCSPMTEVSVERLFSHLGYILNPQRNSLSGEILNDILFLRLNNKFSQFTDREE